MVDLTAQHSSIIEQLHEALGDVLRRSDFILGEDVERFEREFADYCGCGTAVGVDSGTSALELALRAFDCGPGDEVITVPNTFIATALAISETGAKPVFVDVDPDTWTLDPTQLAMAITARTKAIVPVHLYGQTADMDPIMKMARERGLAVIEDACQAHGALYGGRRAGSLGDAAAFSFYPAKNLGALGDGGMVVLDDPMRADRLRLLRNYGQRTKNHHEITGVNRRLDTIHAAVLRIKLTHLDKWNQARRARAQAYGTLLRGSNVITPTAAAGRDHVWHLYVVRVSDRDGLRSVLDSHGVATGVHYPRPIHLQPAYETLGLTRGTFPVAEVLADEILSLPMYPELPLDSVEKVASLVAEHARTAGPLSDLSGSR